jgi:predicted NBD/HSP70 family sugar kinase
VAEPHDPGRAPANQRSVRRHNLGVVLRHVAEFGPRSRAAIALETGLNKTTVSSLVGELIDFGLVQDTTIELRGTVGRPALPVALGGGRVIGLGLELGVDFLAVLATDLAGGRHHSAVVTEDNRDRPVAEVLGRLAGLAREALQRAADAGQLCAGTVVAVPGLVDSASGRLLVAPNLGWAEVDVPALLRAELDAPAFPIRAENEANLGALAELWVGAGREFRDFIYISGELGIGAGLIVGGELFRGASGFGGELGHVTVDAEGERCACGSRGCVETRVALGALIRAAGLPAGSSVAELAVRAEEDDAVAAVLRDAGHWLGVGVASSANLLNPRGVVIGGYFATLAPWLMPGLEAELAARVLAAEWSPPRVVTSALGAEAAVRGASAAAVRRVFADPALVAELTAAAR